MAVSEGFFVIGTVEAGGAGSALVVGTSMVEHGSNSKAHAGIDSSIVLLRKTVLFDGKRTVETTGGGVTGLEVFVSTAEVVESEGRVELAGFETWLVMVFVR